MRRILLILLGACLWLALPVERAQATEMSTACDSLYESFKNRRYSRDYFAYGYAKGRHACFYNTRSYAAERDCTRELATSGFECKIVAEKHDGRIQITPGSSLRDKVKGDKQAGGNPVSLRTETDRLICLKATTSVNQVWESETGVHGPYVLAARDRRISLARCRELLKWSNVDTASSASSPAVISEAVSDHDLCIDAMGYKWSSWSKKYYTTWNSEDYPVEVELATSRGLTSDSCREILRKPSGDTVIKVALATPKIADKVSIGGTKIASLLRQKHRNAIAVIIGNKKYGGRIPAVAYAHNDADAMKRFVLERLGYRAGNVIDLRDASQAEMLAVFGNSQTHEGKLFNWIRPGKSDVVVFYSGHGVPGMRDKRPYLLAVDSDADHAEITGLAVDTMYANLAKIPARSVTVYLDTCFSGESPKGMIIRATSGLSIAPKMPVSAANLTVITASQADQFASWDEKARHGLFTKHLLSALNGAADGKGFGNSDGLVSLAEVQNYLDDEMSYQARRTWGRRQQASVRGRGRTVLAVLATARDLGDQPAPAGMITPKTVTPKTALASSTPAKYVVLRSANLRVGPSQSAEIVGRAAAHSTVIVTGKAAGKNWYRLQNGSYIFGGLVSAKN